MGRRRRRLIALGFGGGLTPPSGYVFLLGRDGAYLLGADGDYLLGRV